MGRPRRAILSLSLLLTLSSAAHAELPTHHQIILQTDNFPPFNMGPNHKNFARGDEVQGIATDTVREIFKRAGIGYSLTLRSPWDRLYNQTLTDTGHGLFSVTRTEHNERQFKWVGPLARYESVLLASADRPIEVNTLSQAKGLEIGAQKSSGVSQYLESQGLRPIDSLSEDENLRKLLSGRLDLWATADPVWRYYARRKAPKGSNRYSHIALKICTWRCTKTPPTKPSSACSMHSMTSSTRAMPAAAKPPTSAI